MFKIFKTKANREPIADTDYSAHGFVPYAGHVDKTTIYTKDGQLMKVIKIGGYSFETADDEDLDMKKNIRNMLLKGMAIDGLGLYFHIIRKSRSIYDENYQGIDMPDGFATTLDKAWVNKHRRQKSFSNELYISVVKRPSGTGTVGFVERILKAIWKKTDKKVVKELFKESIEQLEEIVSRITNSLKEYSPELLSIYEDENGSFSQLIEFFSKIANVGVESKMKVPAKTIAEYIPFHRLYFGRKAIEVKMQDGTSKFASIVSMKEYPPKTWAGILDELLQQPFELIVTQSYFFTNRQAAINAMQLQQNRMIQAGDKSISQIAEITEALDQAMSGDVAFGYHHLTVMCVANALDQLDNVSAMLITALTNIGSVAVRERVNMEPAFWAQVPGNQSYVVRKATINSLNLASLSSLHNYPTGKAKGNHWGDAVTVFDTTSGTPYYFNFHLRDVGHTTIIGPTGSGKTVLMNFLCAQAQKYKCRLFFFDKDRGADIFLRALGGKYTIIDPSKPCHFNPLLLPDTGANRTFLLDWLKQLVTTNNEVLTASEISLLTAAVRGNYKLAPKDRMLRNIAPFMGLQGPGTIAERFAIWHSNGSHNKVFDNPDDTLDFSKAHVFGFEMAEILRDKVSLGPVLAYIFHKINLSLDGTPTMIVLDEAWALIDNPVFAPKIKDWLKVLRKLNAFVVFATQSVEDATKSAISDTLVQQTATQIFLPNLKATSEYRKVFMLTEREYNLIKTTDPGSRYFLVKQGNNAVVARVDLTGMDDIIAILSGRADTVLLLDEIRAQYGDDPDMWIPIFCKRVKNLK